MTALGEAGHGDEDARSSVKNAAGRAMMDVLFHGVGWTDLALTLNRIAVGMFFMLSGYHKLFNAQRHVSLVEELKELGIPAVGFNQWWVPAVEFTGGAGVTIGLLAPLTALGLLVIILVAIATSGDASGITSRNSSPPHRPSTSHGRTDSRPRRANSRST